jgi:iron complex transport system ATP-binding protein
MNQIKAMALSVDLGRTRIVDNVDLEIAGGSVIGVIGPNGAGKSTLLRALAGLIPCHGDVSLNGVPITRLSLSALARMRAYLGQDSDIHWPLTVRATVGLGRYPHHDALATSGVEAVNRALHAANVAHFADRPVTELSGGERARVMLARVLATEAGIIIADEPAAQLDPRHHWQALTVLKGAAANGAVVVMALHDLTAAARMCDRVLVMHGGKMQAFGSPSDVLTPDLLERVFGVDALIGSVDGAPYVVPLRASAPPTDRAVV